MRIKKGDIKKSIENCTVEAIPSTIMSNSIDYLTIPFALFLGANNNEIGLISGFPSLFSSILLLFSIYLIKLFNGRKNFLIFSTFFQILSVILISMLSFSQSKNKILIFIILIIIYKIILNVTNSAWSSLISQYLPINKRGTYLGKRSQIVSITGLVIILFIGLFLKYFEKANLDLGFFIIFLLIALCRVPSIIFFRNMTDLKWNEKPALVKFNFSSTNENSFRKYVLFISALTFASYISSPFFSVYMLKELKLSYLTFSIIQMFTVFGYIIANPIWGRHADILGNIKIVKITSFFIQLYPVLWLISDSPIYLVILNIWGGILWSGFYLSSNNFIYDAISPNQRIKAISYFNFLNGVALFLGSFLGGLWADNMIWFKGSIFISLFILSTVMRSFVHWFLISNLNEVRTSIKKYSNLKIALSLLKIKSIN